MQQNKLNQIKKLFAEFKFQEILDEFKSLDQLSQELLRYKADSLFELGEFEQAKQIYSELSLHNSLGFCFLMQGDFENAKKAYLQASSSSAQKWGLFITLLFSRTDKVFPGPGFLTFRLFFESTYFYLLKFQKTDYLNRINECVHQLTPLYPDVPKEIQKAQATFAARNTAL